MNAADIRAKAIAIYASLRLSSVLCDLETWVTVWSNGYVKGQSDAFAYVNSFPPPAGPPAVPRSEPYATAGQPVLKDGAQ